MSLLKLASLAAAVVAMSGTPGHAQISEFPSVLGSTCNLVSGPARFTGNRVRFAEGETGTIKVDCTINKKDIFENSGTALFAAIYRDSTGTGSGASVKAFVVGISDDDQSIMSQIVFNSDDFADTGKTTRVGLTPAVSDDTRLYLVRVELRRSRTAQTVAFYGGFFFGI